MPVDFGDVRLTDRQVSGSGVTILGRTLFNRNEYNADLVGQSGTRVYEKMRRDPEISGALQRWKAPLLGASWKFERPKKSTRQTDAMMDLCERYIGARLKREILPQVLLKLDFGFSVIEKVWGMNPAGQNVYIRFAPVLPQSVIEFTLDDLGGCASVVQYAYVPNGAGGWTFKRQEIPDPAVGGTAKEKIAVFTYRKEGDDYFGRPLLREVYQPWYHKQELWALDGVQKERNSLGLTIIKLPSVVLDPTSDKYTAAMEIAENLRSSEAQGAVIGQDWEIQQLWPTGTPPDIKSSMDYCDEQIARAMLTQWALLASSSSTGGGRSLGESQIDHFMLCEQALADSAEQEIQDQLVAPMLERNFGNVDPEDMPRLQCEDLDKMTGGQQAALLKDLKAAGVIRYDRKLEEHVRENNDLPEIDDATREDAPEPAAFGTGDPNSTADQGAGRRTAGTPAPDAPTTKKAAGMPVSTDGPAAAPSRFGRAPLPHEAHVPFEKMADYLDQEPSRIWYRVVKPFRDQQIAAISAAAANATVPKLSSGEFISPGKVPRQARLADELTTALMAVYTQGRKSVLEDKAAQRASAVAAKAAGDVGDQADSEEEDQIDITPAQRSWVRNIANGFAAGATISLISEAVRAGLDAHQQNLPQAEVENVVRRALQDLSEPRLMADLSGAVTRTYTNGRVEQGQGMADQLTSVFYSAMMDSSTCGPCSAMDGSELDPETYDAILPNPNCEGGDRCRCEPVFVFRPMTNQQEAA